jgi:hypothetical protein
MTTATVVKLSAAIEAGTGLAAIVGPSLFAEFLLGTELSAGGVALGRVAGMALISLAIACWPNARSTSPQALRSLLVYNLFVGIYLGFLRVNHDFHSGLLWPACALHICFAIVLARRLFGETTATSS